MKTALVVGASGLVGSFVLEHLLSNPDYAEVKVLARKALNQNHPKLKQCLVDFDQLDTVDPSTFSVTDAFSCLGTTLGRTGEQSIYRRIEVDYPLQIATKVLSSGGRSFHYVSAIGSSSKSPINYSKMKGETEDSLRDLQKRYPHTCMASFRPCFISGPRKEKRLLEQIALPIWSGLEIFMQGPLRKFRSVHAETIAKAMIAQTSAKSGFYLIDGDDIERLGRRS
jgi:nucleoside-diphosphate-sugar epimerase